MAIYAIIILQSNIRRNDLLMSEKSSLFKKIGQVRAKVGDVPKTGYNSFQNYPYHTESDILGAVKPLMAEAGLSLIPSLDWDHAAVAGVPVIHNGDIVTVLTKYTIVDNDTGETFECYWSGAGQDKGDKGINKAFTSSGKYFMIKLFGIAEEEDADKEGPTSNAASSRTTSAANRTTAPATRPAAAPAAASTAGKAVCVLCKEEVPSSVANFSEKKFGTIYCFECQKKVAK
jgi:hypothetical protein